MKRTEPPKAVIYTDGSSHLCHGGWACLVNLFTDDDNIVTVELTGYDYPTTNNRMEMQAAIEGLSWLLTPHQVYLASDSSYVLSTLKEKWYESWKDPEKRPNWDLWQKLIALTEVHEMVYVKVKGHDLKAQQDPFNDRVDKLAGEARMRGLAGDK